MNNQEYLTKARKLLTEDYKSKHTDEYNIWLSRCKDSWMQPHIIVPFPPFIVSSALSPFKPSVSAPNEEDITAKALELYNQFNPAPVSVSATPQSAPVAQQAPAPIDELLSSPAVQISIKEPVAEPVVEEIIVEPVVEEIIVKIASEPIIEETIDAPVVQSPPPVHQYLYGVLVPDSVPDTETIVTEPVVVDITKNTDVIYKIFQEPAVEEPVALPTVDPLPPTIETALNVVPQPAEELAKVNTGRILPSVLQKIQDLKLKWSSTGEQNV